ncbi:hypothetical protein MTR67_001463 [Solanum verrucosum]|uniref:MULE transposase domain-containing protein n=1 Tax=Solanum verrucosum TaxID=315347 RepID=A0AAF0T7I4_SOLVR|nr:hypothetical protein MTR67_001461 [Solanum verrucosum]WMV08078.1 hypothetical protein MTR67_001463 [Solanum verrucosum]
MTHNSKTWVTWVHEDVKEFREVVTKYSLQKGLQLEKYINEPKKLIWKELKILVGKTTARRARGNILLFIMGDHVLDVGRIFDNRNEMLRTNPGSTYVIKVDDSAGSGRLGLQSALQNLLPEVDNRMCARHILTNWENTWRGPRHKTIIIMLEEIRVKDHVGLSEVFGPSNVAELNNVGGPSNVVGPREAKTPVVSEATTARTRGRPRKKTIITKVPPRGRGRPRKETTTTKAPPKVGGRGEKATSTTEAPLIASGRGKGQHLLLNLFKNL